MIVAHWFLLLRVIRYLLKSLANLHNSMVLWHLSVLSASHLQAANALIYSHAVKNVCVFCAHRSCVRRGGSS